MVHDVHCNKCLRVVGWRYERAFEESQKYKEGKFVLERAKLNQRGRKAAQTVPEPQPLSDDEDEDDI